MQLFSALNSILLLVAFAVNLGLSLFIYFKSPPNNYRNIFSFLLLLLGLLNLFVLLASVATDAQGMLFWVRGGYCCAALIPAVFAYFSLVFPAQEKMPGIFQRLAIFGPALVFAWLAYTPLIEKKAGFPFQVPPTFGPAMPVFTLYIIGLLLYGLYNLVRKYLSSHGVDKLQIWYLLFGVTLTALVVVTFNIILPQFFGLAFLAASGPAASLILVSLVAYAIVKHRLLNIPDFLSRGVLFLSMTSVSVVTLAAVITRNASFLLPAYTVIGCLALAGIVFLQSPHSGINRSFSGLIIFIALWSFFNYLSDHALILREALFWNRLVFATSALFPIFAVFFATYFPERKTNNSWPGRLIIVVLSLGIASLSLFTDWVVESAIFVNGRTELSLGPLFIWHSLFVSSALLYALAILGQKYYQAHGLHKVQIKYVFLGCLISVVLALITNVFMVMAGNFSLSFMGPSFMLILLGFTTYAILRHRLLSVELVLQKGLIYTAITTVIMAIYALTIMFSEQLFAGLSGINSYLITGIAALIVALFFQPLVHLMQAMTDRLFFRSRYDYQKTLREISQKIASVIRLEELTHLVASSFIDTIKVSEISFLLLDRDQEHFRSAALALPRYKKIEIDIQSPIVSCLCVTHDVLVKEEIEDEIHRQEGLGKDGEIRSKGLKDVYDEMERLGISIWVPIIAKDRLIGIIALGNKLSGDVYTSEDLGLLSTLASQIAVVLENARLYDEVVGMKNYNEGILEAMVSGVITVDIKTRVITFNHMAERISGRKAAEVLGKTCEEIWGKRGVIVNVVENTLQKDKCYVNFESSIASPERGIVPVSFSSTILVDRQAKKIGVLLTMQDMSEVKELEGKVRRADKLAALATMAAGMAHEIKNPLSSMKVLSQLLPLKYEEAEFRQKITEIFPREINRIDRIVESLLGFTRASALTFEKTDLNKIIEETLEYLEPQAKASEVKITRSLAELPEVEVDRGQIAQVFSNLILNAIQAMPSGGELKVTTGPGKKVEDILQSVKIEIADNGPGIAPDNLKRLFDPFFTTKYGGTGLGLTITHSIVDGHKGYIDLDSQLGKGTTFIVTLPVSQGLI